MLQAKGIHSLHSPFLFEFYREVVRHPYPFSIYEILEEERRLLLADDSLIRFEEAGAGRKEGQRRISAIASSSLMPFEKAAFLLRLCHWLKPAKTIELGTCLGLTTAYLAQNCREVFTFEASSELCRRSTLLWEKLAINNIRLLEGRIEETLPAFLQQQTENWDFAVMDANHRYEAALQQFELLKSSRAYHACLILDDVYWSAGMTRAWKEIQQDPAVSVSVDFFHFGIVFFRPEMQKQHFVLRW